MRLLKIGLLLIGAALCLGCEDATPTGPAPSPSPTPVPLADLCEVKKVSLGLTVDGHAARVWGLGQIATFKANLLYAGESMTLPDGQTFDPNSCPQQTGFHWDKTGAAADGCTRQGQRDGQSWTLACNVPGTISVCASPYDYSNIVGCFDSEVMGL